MGLNHAEIFARIEALTAGGLPTGVCMNEIIDLCSRDAPHDSWSRFKTLGYDADVSSLASWIPNVFEKQPAPFPIRALWVGLCNLGDDDGSVWADMQVAAMGQYDLDDEEMSWLWKKPRHYPEDAYANSSSLRGIYEIAYVPGGLGIDAEWPLCLAFGAFALRSLLQGGNTGRLVSDGKPVGVVVGFNDGDMMQIGEMTDRGFKSKP